MRARSPFALDRVASLHPLQWLWEPLQGDPTFVLRPMFGGKSAYLDGKLMLYFAAKAEPWSGVLVCTDRTQHASLQREFPELSPHPILPKWLYLSAGTDRFESIASRLVALARRRDPRIGVVPKPERARRRTSTRRRAGLDSHP
ncbi:MAG: hypothetical protein HZC55_09135 [Verrucomicrobia bacterium]|nr:hypothetical protein [Verrucomicrobiota bacterium]